MFLVYSLGTGKKLISPLYNKSYIDLSLNMLWIIFLEQGGRGASRHRSNFTSKLMRISLSPHESGFTIDVSTEQRQLFKLHPIIIAKERVYVSIPNPHHRKDIGVKLLIQILREAASLRRIGYQRCKDRNLS